MKSYKRLVIFFMGMGEDVRMRKVLVCTIPCVSRTPCSISIQLLLLSDSISDYGIDRLNTLVFVAKFTSAATAAAEKNCSFNFFVLFIVWHRGDIFIECTTTPFGQHVGYSSSGRLKIKTKTHRFGNDISIKWKISGKNERSQEENSRFHRRCSNATCWFSTMC